MTAALDHYTRVADTFEARLRGVAADQWQQTVPSCPEWTVRELVAHLIGMHHLVLGSLGQKFSPPEGDLEDAWIEARQAVVAALQDDAVAAATTPSPAGPVKFTDLTSGLLANDTIYHTWDLARATGQNETLDPELCERALASMVPMEAAIRGPGLFGARIEVSQDADAQTRLLAFGGRQA